MEAFKEEREALEAAGDAKWTDVKFGYDDDVIQADPRWALESVLRAEGLLSRCAAAEVMAAVCDTPSRVRPRTASQIQLA